MAYFVWWHLDLRYYEDVSDPILPLPAAVIDLYYRPPEIFSIYLLIYYLELLDLATCLRYILSPPTEIIYTYSTIHLEKLPTQKR